MAQKFNTRFAHTKNPSIEFKDPSRTQQQFGFEVDINNIVKGMVPINSTSKQPMYDLSFSPDDYENAINIIAEAKSKFEELPSSIRNEFDNDPKKLLAFIQDENNYNKAVKLGLIDKKIDTVQDVATSESTSTVTPVASETTGNTGAIQT